VISGMLLPGTAQAETAWVQDQIVQQQLSDRQVAVRVEFDGDQSRMHVRAAVRINASPQSIWQVLTDCDHAASFIPGVKHCRRVQSAPDGSWDLIEQSAKYSWLMPPVTCVVRADYKRPRRIDFKRVSGDLKDEEGTWLLEMASPSISQEMPAAAALTHPPPNAALDASHPATTIVEYELHVDPGFWIPRVLLRHSLRTELPAALTALRARSENTATER